jgi:hypothetical protein
MLNPARWPLSYVQGESLKGSGGDSVRLANHRALVSRKQGAQSMSCQNQPPFQVGDEVVFTEDPAHIERVINITWIDAPIPHWQCETCWFIFGREQRRIANADEFRASFPPDPNEVAFRNVMRWALALGCEAGGGPPRGSGDQHYRRGRVERLFRDG